MTATVVVFVGARRMLLADHAVERYVERVKPHLSLVQSRVELCRLLRLVEVTSVRPAWVSSCDGEDAWVELSDGIVLPVVRGCLVTCMTRAGTGEALRITRRQERAERRDKRARPGARQKHGKVAREDRRRRRDEKARLADG